MITVEQAFEHKTVLAARCAFTNALRALGVDESLALDLVYRGWSENRAIMATTFCKVVGEPSGPIQATIISSEYYTEGEA